MQYSGESITMLPPYAPVDILYCFWSRFDFSALMQLQNCIQELPEVTKPLLKAFSLCMCFSELTVALQGSNC
jgi:hypothetical protein